MAILQGALVEPLLSRQQIAVVREIAHAAQLNEALIAIQKLDLTKVSIPTGHAIGVKATVSENENIRQPIIDYLQAEIIRVLMQIKTPAPQSVSK